MTWFILGFPVHIISVYSDPVIIHSLDKKYQLKSIPVQSFICYIWRKGVNQEYKQNCFLGLDVRIWCSISGTFPDGNWWNTTTGDSIETMQTVFWIPIPILGSKKINCWYFFGGIVQREQKRQNQIPLHSPCCWQRKRGDHKGCVSITRHPVLPKQRGVTQWDGKKTKKNISGLLDFGGSCQDKRHVTAFGVLDLCDGIQTPKH